MKNLIYAISIIFAAMATLSFNTKSHPDIQNTQDVIDYMTNNNLQSISIPELEQLQQLTTSPTPTTELDYELLCTDIEYCGLDSADLIQYIDNYRDSVWSKTSPHFHTNTYTEDVLFDGNDHEDEFDARFMDMDIDKLENYICILRNSSIGSEVNTIRFYYIRYNENSAPMTNFEWKHSLAMVPAKIAQDGTTTKEYIGQLESNGSNFSLAADVNSFCANTPAANHSRLCPPMTGCVDGTLLEEADTN